jgi:hypothetical protein
MCLIKLELIRFLLREWYPYSLLAEALVPVNCKLIKTNDVPLL